MAEPCFAITGDDARHYVNPLSPTVNKKSITTIKKQGVPNTILEMWRGKEVTLYALANLETLKALEERISGDK